MPPVHIRLPPEHRKRPATGGTVARCSNIADERYATAGEIVAALEGAASTAPPQGRHGGVHQLVIIVLYFTSSAPARQIKT
jgi:hypothetical protein